LQFGGCHAARKNPDWPPQTTWQYLRFRVEELFLDSKSGAFKLEDSRLRSAFAIERLYLVAAVALLYGTTQHGSTDRGLTSTG